MFQMSDSRLPVQGSHTRLPWLAAMAAFIAATLLAGCSSTPPAPPPRTEIIAQPAWPTAPIPAGFYRVLPGDTLASVAAAFAHSPAELAAWNGIPAEAQLQAGNIVRVAPLTVPAAPAAPPAQPPQPAAQAAPPRAPSTATLVWPLERMESPPRPYERGSWRGLALTGHSQAAVRAAAAGTVIYAGSRLGAYGTMIIVRHGSSLVSAYAHLGSMLVGENQRVQQGQAVGTLANNPAGPAQFEFQVLDHGRPVDPLPMLPAL